MSVSQLVGESVFFKSTQLGDIALFNKRLLLIIFVIPIIVVVYLYVKDSHLDIYTIEDNGNLRFGNKVYQSGNETHTKYYSNGERELKVGQVIGKTENSSFFGFKETVYKIKGKSPDEVVFLKGLMYEEVYQRK